MRAAWPSILILLLMFASASIAQPDDATGNVPQPTVDWTDCAACHTLPGADLPRLADLRPAALGADLPVSCYSCHTDLELLRPVNVWRHPAQPLAMHLACTDCHVAVEHGKDKPPPLPTGDYAAVGCYRCHAAVRAQRRMAHGHHETLVQRCRDCHPPHAPLQVALPAQLIPLPARRHWQAGYDWERSNTDCLDCHSAGLLMLGLRDGFVTLNTENYHDRHVVRGRVLCIECHAPHGGPDPAMVRSRLLTGESLSYVQTPTGGRCSTNCHGVAHNSFSYINEAY